MTIVLGLDCANRTGWCALDVNAADQRPDLGLVARKIDLGTWVFSGTDGERGLALGARVRSLVEEYRPELVVFEKPLVLKNQKGTRAMELRFGFVMVARMICAQMKVPVHSVPPPTLKKFATGKGTANKQKMIQAAHAETGRWLTSDEADAYWLARFGVGSLLGETLFELVSMGDD